MTIGDKQRIFAHNVAKLITYIYEQGYAVSLGEAYRPPETARLYAQQGRGIKDSLHCDKLAIDLNLFDGHGEYLPDTEAHKPFGGYWETLHSDNKWGGMFKRSDGNHYQMNKE